MFVNIFLPVLCGQYDDKQQPVMFLHCSLFLMKSLSKYLLMYVAVYCWLVHSCPKCMLGKISKHKHSFCLILIVLHPVLPIASIKQDPDQPIPSVVRPQLHPVTSQQPHALSSSTPRFARHPIPLAFFLLFTFDSRSLLHLLHPQFYLWLPPPHNLRSSFQVSSWKCLPSVRLWFFFFHCWSIVPTGD